MHRSDDEDADIMSAVTAMKQTEAQLQEHLAQHAAAHGFQVQVYALLVCWPPVGPKDTK